MGDRGDVLLLLLLVLNTLHHAAVHSIILLSLGVASMLIEGRYFTGGSGAGGRKGSDDGLAIGVCSVPLLLASFIKTRREGGVTDDSAASQALYMCISYSLVAVVRYIKCNIIVKALLLLSSSLFPWLLLFVQGEQIEEYGVTVGVTSAVVYLLTLQCFLLLSSSFSYGESVIISSLSNLLLLHVVLTLLGALRGGVPILENVAPLSGNISVLVAVGLLGVLTVAVLPAGFRWFIVRELRALSIVETVIYYLCLAGAAGCILLTMFVVMGTNPLLFVWTYISEREVLLPVLVYWVAILIAVIIWNPNSSRLKLPNIIVRKVYHFVAVVMFMPLVFLQQLEFLKLAMAVALCALLIVEYIRLVKLPPFGDDIHNFMIAYVDSRDSGPVILTHMYLLVGCALPLWVQPRDNILVGISGINVLGIGDAFAAIVGSTVGKHRWRGTNKSVEGTVACSLTMFIFTVATVLLLDFYSVSSYPLTSGIFYIKVIFACVVMSLLETFTTQIDNLVLPILAVHVFSYI